MPAVVLVFQGQLWKHPAMVQTYLDPENGAGDKAYRVGGFMRSYVMLMDVGYVWDACAEWIGVL